MKELDILNEFYKVLRIGMDSYSDVSKKVVDNQMKNELSYQYKEYSDILSKVNNQLASLGDVAKDTSAMDKAMVWTGVELNTLNDKTNSHIADMIIQGSTMGITKSTKILNENPKMNSNISNIIQEFITLENNSIEQLKKYL
ncbi:MAG: hypothetical protein RSB76_01765 [Clostridia bacterium]